MVYQMARCDRDYSCNRRVADRGNDRVGPDSHARGEDRHLTRRIADRGSGRVGVDSRDFEIKRLRQRVLDLEVIKRLTQRVQDLEEIKRLCQRVRDLELRWEIRFKETESGTIVWDDVNEEGMHPFCYPHPWFYEPIYQEILSEEKPRFDEDAIEPDEEGCSLVQTLLDGTTNRDDELVKESNGHEYPDGSSGIFDFLYKDVVVNGGSMVAVGDAFPLDDTKCNNPR
ncbi:hypothetical protein HanHA300_Chr04g0134181 [Helianthus annuus]|nr:hypothetical protein HanHA300_Chr04g0134181 [Helianthus annuus]KAJ0588567.1 hypothetical protein HanIR_Chr04g0176111 [Helianthus annuus]KAJ0596798.1 hypothetical protein HanHA89_Chr04g0147051 [Helianthus annuus]KAJ0757478.1 hypothetical protein HanLR1_Chr04g0139171 [Helianthus annuus]KAJ0761168.1 hypothetical protein HanOQP8_Chr04g0146611 [Helianthus annuus]